MIMFSTVLTVSILVGCYYSVMHLYEKLQKRQLKAFLKAYRYQEVDEVLIHLMNEISESEICNSNSKFDIIT